jgi:hypothetical protein
VALFNVFGRLSESVEYVRAYRAEEMSSKTFLELPLSDVMTPVLSTLSFFVPVAFHPVLRSLGLGDVEITVEFLMAALSVTGTTCLLLLWFRNRKESKVTPLANPSAGKKKKHSNGHSNNKKK